MPYDSDDDWHRMRDKIIGLGEHSYYKSYYPELQKKIADLEQFRALLDESNDIIFLIRAKDCCLVDVSGSASQQLGFSRDEFLKMSIYDIVKGDAIEIVYRMFLGNTERINFTTSIGHKSGRLIPYEIDAHIVRLKDAVFAVAVARDVTERLKIEGELRRSEETYRVLFDSSYDGIVLLDRATMQVVDINNAARQIFKIERIEANFKDILDTFFYETISKNKVIELFSKVETGGPAKFILKVRDSTGRVFWADLTIKYVLIHGKDRIMIIIRDIDEKHLAEEQIIASLNEKEVMLKEIHHRVKNNLQVISSLLNIQTQYLRDPIDVEIFKDSQNRIKSMALVHENLYGSSDLSQVDFVSYIDKITTGLFQMYNQSTGRIHISLDLQSVSMGIDTAVPCGLIVNELISNCLKYAFPGDRKGEIRVFLYKSGQTITLVISDDGIGLPEEFEVSNISTLGLQLVYMLVDQIDGKILLDRSAGTKFTITFSSEGK